jgi:hypothetical protein
VREPVIIDAAINGATPKTANPNVPVTEDEIAFIQTRDVARVHRIAPLLQSRTRMQRVSAAGAY